MAPRVAPLACLIALLWFAPAGLVKAEDVPRQLTGIVRDAGTYEHLPAVNIRVSGSTRGTTTNADGVYRIELPPGFQRLIFSCIGYSSDTLDLALQAGEHHDVALRSSVLPLDEVTIVGEGGNPAEAIIRKAIRKKQESAAGLTAYSFKAYTKTTLRLPRVKDGTRDTIIAGLLETQTEGFWEHPDKYKEIITARRQSANFSAAQNVFSMGRLPNLNDDQTVIGQLSVVGPTSPEALDYYAYDILDTLAIDRMRVFRLLVTPKSNVRPLFSGTIAIADESFRVMQVDVRGNEALDVPPYENLHIRQQFSLYNERYWLPIESSTDFCVRVQFPPLPPLLWQQSSLVSDYEIGEARRRGSFDRHLVTTLPLADRQDSSVWASSAVRPLTMEEAEAYRKLDTLMSRAGIVARSAVFLARLPIILRGLPVTGFSDFFHFNRAEGGYVGAGVDLTGSLGNSRLTLAGGYGLADRRWKYRLAVEHAFSSDRFFSLGGGLHRSMLYREGEAALGRGTITWLALLDKTDPVDYYLGEGFSLFSSVKPAHDLDLRLEYLGEWQSSVAKRTDYSILRPTDRFRSNLPIADGYLRSLTATVTYDTRRFIDAGFLETLDESQDATFLMFTAEIGGRGFLRSAHAYDRYDLRFSGHTHAVGPGTMNVMARVGVSRGILPPQRQFDVPAKAGGIAPTGAFRCVRPKEFAGDRIATFQVEYNFGVLPFRALGIPFLRNLDFIVHSGTAWSGFRHRAPAVEGQPARTAGGPYQEAGFAIGHLLTFFRLDFTWRLTHRDGDDISLTLGSSLF